MFIMDVSSRKASFIKRVTKATFVSLISFILLACAEKTTEEYIQQASVFVEQGDNRAAIVELKNAVQLNPRHAAARFELGSVYISEKDFNSAEKELSKALELGYPSNKVIPMLTEAYQRVGANVALADLEYDTKNLTSIEKLQVGYRQLQSLLQLEKNYEALDLIDELSLIDSNSVYKGLVEAHRFVLEKDFELALKQAEALHERAPLNRDILGFTARLYMLNGRDKEAADMYEEYVRVASDDIELKFALASMLVQQGEFERAVVHVDELLLLSSNNALLNHLKGIISAAEENYPEALAYSEKAIQLGLQGPRVRLVAGFSSFRLGDYEQAVSHLSRIEDVLADGHPALRILASAQIQANMGIQASKILPRLTDVSEEDANLFSKTGYKLLQEGNIEAAKEVIEQTDKISVTADELTRLAILKLSVKDIGGLLNLEQAVEKAPDSKSARSILGEAYISTGQINKALKLAKEWQTSAPNEVSGFILESEVLQTQSNYEEAKAVLAKAEKFAPDDSELLVALVRINVRLQELPQALILAEKLLQKEPENIMGLAGFYTIKAAQNQPEVALTRIKDAFEKSDKNKDLALLLARSALTSNDVKLSLQALNTIENNRSASNPYWTMKGTALARDNQLIEAENHYATWAELFPNQAAAVQGHVLLLNDKREYKKALTITTEFLSRNESDQISMLQASFYAKTNDVENAKKSYSKVNEKYSTLPFLRGVRARIALLENKPGDAVDDALAAYQSNRNTDNLFVAVRALQLSGQSVRRDELLDSHSKAFPKDIRTKLMLAEGYIKTDTQAAISTYRDILTFAPNNVVVLNNLAYLLMVEGSLDDAEVLAERAYSIQPTNLSTADTFAQILVKQGKTEQAVEVYSKVINDEVTNEDLVLNYIHALLSNGSTIVAKRRLAAREFRNPVSKVRIDELKKEFNL